MDTQVIVTGTYEPALVILSYVVATVASFTALTLARHVAQNEGRAAWRWLVAGAFSMGIGIWSMHFVGMLAFRMDMPHTYDPVVTGLSMVVAILASGFAIYIASRSTISVRRLGVSGLVMGFGIAGMHYTGMAAMRMEGSLRYDPLLFAASIVIAILAATAALAMAFRVSSRGKDNFGFKISAALIMGLAICGLHYTGMEAAIYSHHADLHHAMMAESGNHIGLAISVSVATLFILFGTLLTVFFDYRHVVQKQVEAQLTEMVDERTRELTGTIYDLEVAQAELEKLRQGLEEGVRRRTAELTAANRELEAFAYSVSHDLRAPLRALGGFTAALVEDYGDRLDDAGSDFIGHIQDAAEQMSKLIDDLLRLSRITRAEMHYDSVDLSGLARSITTRLRESAPERDVEILIQDDLVVEGDHALLNAAIGNLLDNAWKYSRNSEKARIEFSAMAENGTSVFRVRDNGAGFDMAYSDKLFQPFERLHTTYEFEGSGIGLANVQRIIARHGGRIWAEGKPGEGASFYFTVSETN